MSCPRINNNRVYIRIVNKLLIELCIEIKIKLDYDDYINYEQKLKEICEYANSKIVEKNIMFGCKIYCLDFCNFDFV